MTDRLDVVCHYHTPAKATLLRDAVLPALALATGGGVTAHLERHWRHGPHVRVCLAGPPGQLPGVAERIAARLREHLAAHPSRAGLGTAALLAQAEAAGRAELVPPPYTPIHPDNTVRIEPVDPVPLAELLGSAEAVGCRADLLRRGVPAVAHTLRQLAARGDSAAARVELTLTAVAGHAARYPLGFGAGHQSFVSHVEDFLLYHDPDATLRDRFARQWSRRGDTVTDLVARIVDERDRPPVAGTWGEWSEAARTATEPVYDRGGLATTPGATYTRRARQVGDPATIRRWDPDQRAEYSEFHQLFNQVDYHRLTHEREFAVYRFTTNILYLLLGLCDVQPGERYLAAYLVGRAAERITGLTWRERIHGYLAAQAATTQEVST